MMQSMTHALKAMAGGFAIAAAAATTPASSQETGETLFNNACRTCHSVKPDDNRLGPNLHNIVGRKSGAASGFNYSPSLKGGAITWDEATLDKFIANPDSVASGNTMKPFTGIADANVRQQIIEFLKTGAK